MSVKIYILNSLVFLIIAGFFLTTPFMLLAATADELRNQIDSHNQQISDLESEIANYQKQLNSISAEKQTLQGTLDQLNLSRKKITASISVAQNQISATQLEITQLGGSITDKEELISNGNDGLSESIRALYESEANSLAIVILRSGSLASVWDDTNTLLQFQDSVKAQIKDLETAKTDLEEAKTDTEQKQAELIEQRNDLRTQQRALDVNREEQEKLVKETANKESNYQALIAEKEAAKERFEDELTAYQSELQYTLDPSSIPTSGQSTLAWPLKNVIITQKFGNTAFAQSGAYNGSGHNGIDFGASIGTPLYSALTGTVQGTGNTDAYAGCYSYGKWVLIRHPNGLSTLYAHMSQIDVTVGQRVTTGERIGYTGFTGYATGPHLHFSLYVSDAVQIVKLGSVKSRTNCAEASVPIAPLNAYLNPLDYLP